MFFKGIYDKTATYFSNLVNKIYSELSHLLVKMDNRIMTVQKEEQEELERQRQAQKRKELHEQREKEKNEMMTQLRKMEELKSEVTQMGSTSHAALRSLDDTLNYLNSLEDEFNRLKQDCSKLQNMNRDMQGNLTKIENTYIRRTAF